MPTVVVIWVGVVAVVVAVVAAVVVAVYCFNGNAVVNAAPLLPMLN